MRGPLQAVEDIKRSGRAKDCVQSETSSSRGPAVPGEAPSAPLARAGGSACPPGLLDNPLPEPDSLNTRSAAAEANWNIAELALLGGQGEWDTAVKVILLKSYDANPSGTLDTIAEIDTISCEDWNAIGVGEGWSMV